MKLLWVGPFLVDLTSYEIWWQRMPYTDFEGWLFHITFPWCWRLILPPEQRISQMVRPDLRRAKKGLAVGEHSSSYFGDSHGVMCSVFRNEGPLLSSALIKGGLYTTHGIHDRLLLNAKPLRYRGWSWHRNRGGTWVVVTRDTLSCCNFRRMLRS